MTILDFFKMKREKQKLSMVTCYDYTSACLVSQSQVDVILVGDSVAMTMHGHTSTIPATVEMMALHIAAVSKGAPKKFIVGDFPFPWHRRGPVDAMVCADALMKAGANSVKIEGVEGHEETIEHLIGAGVPVMGHLGLTPQSIHQLGGYRVQGREEGALKLLLAQAQRLESLGAFAVVLECIPAAIASVITESLKVPTIGIGAGPDCDGQVLVWQDLLGLNTEFRPKFLKTYANAGQTFIAALNQYDTEVKSKLFPTEKESYE